MEVHFSAEMFKQKPKQYHLPLESQAFLFSHITGFPCYGLLNARSRNTNHPIGNMAILLIHIGTHSNYLPLTIYQKNPGINIISYYDPSVFFTIAKILNHLGGPTELPPRSGSLQPSYEAMIRSSFLEQTTVLRRSLASEE